MKRSYASISTSLPASLTIARWKRWFASNHSSIDIRCRRPRRGRVASISSRSAAASILGDVLPTLMAAAPSCAAHAAAERVLDHVERQRRDDEVAALVAFDEAVAHQPGQALVDAVARHAGLRRDRVEVERRADREQPPDDERAHRGVGALVAGQLEPPELAPVVGERRAGAGLRTLDLGEEDRVRAAGHVLDDAALDVRQRAREQRLAEAARRRLDAGELVGVLDAKRLASSPCCASRMLTAKRPSRLDGRTGRRLPVHADQQHRRLERERGHRARGRARAACPR